MSEEVQEVEQTTLEDQTDQVGSVSIQVSDNSVKYDTNMTLPEMLFWIEVVKNMAIEKVMDRGSTNG